MSIIGQSNAFHNRFAMGGGFFPAARMPMARPAGPIFMFGATPMMPQHCDCGEKAAIWGGVIGGVAGIFAGLFGRKQTTVVQYAPPMGGGYGGGYGGGAGSIQGNGQYLNNLKQLYTQKGYTIVDNGDGTFTATDKNGNNVGRGDYNQMQEILGKTNPNAPDANTANGTDGSGSNTTGTDGQGGTDKTTTPDGKAVTPNGQGNTTGKPDSTNGDDNKTGDATNKTADGTNGTKGSTSAEGAKGTDETGKGGSADEAKSAEETEDSDGTAGAGASKGTGATRGAGGAHKASGTKKTENKPQVYKSSSGRIAKKGADGKWHYYAKDGTELKEDFISKNGPEYASKKKSVHTAKNGDYITKDKQGRCHYFDKNGKPMTEKQFKDAHKTINTTNIKQGGYSTQKGHRIKSSTGRYAERGKGGWHYFAQDGTELKPAYVQKKDPELWKKTHPQAQTQKQSLNSNMYGMSAVVQNKY